MDKLTIVKVGGKIVEDETSLAQLLNDFSSIEGYKIIVHGGGRTATKMAEKLGIKSTMIEGRRITDLDMLQVVTMVYAGLINKNIVAKLQAKKINAIGLTGADLNILLAEKRPITKVDYGYVGDIKKANTELLSILIQKEVVPVLAPLTHDGEGQLLNTNADTIAGEIAKALSIHFDVRLIYCFEKKGVLRDENDENSTIAEISDSSFKELLASGTIHGGMIPKIENAFTALKAGVREVIISQASDIHSNEGTRIYLQ
ncbi:acetylglutamate kinase [Bacteroidales bacterium]|nr:acetylglutamate kinase [Bacteroidales bacterium]